MNKLNERDSQIQRTNWCLPEDRGIRELGEKGERMKKYKLAVTKLSWGCGVITI